MKNLFLISMAFALLTNFTNLYAQNDFVAKSPQTDQFENLCYPVKAGNSIKIPITVKCNMTKQFQPYKVSIDTFASFNGYYGWVKVDNVTQSIDSGQTKTYNLTIKPPKTPVFTQDGQYPIEISFTVTNKNNETLTNVVNKPSFKVIVDNTPPVKPIISVQTKKSNYLSIQGCSSVDPGNLSYTYCLYNDTAGIAGIQNLTFMLKRTSNNTIIENKSMKIENTRDWYAFSSIITPNTTYEATVAASDLAGNKNTSNVLTVTTPPAPPASCTIPERTYCSVTLQWPSSQGATGYYLCNESNQLITNSLITTNSYTVNGLVAGTTYKFYIKAYSDAGGISEVSPLFSTSTLAVPTPIISGPPITCSSGVVFNVTSLPSGCSAAWNYSSNLAMSSSTSSSATFLPVGNGLGQISAKFVTCGGDGSYSSQSSIWIGTPANITFAGPGVLLKDRIGTYTVNEAVLQQLTSYEWDADGGLFPYGSTTLNTFKAKAYGCDSSDVMCTVSNVCGGSTFGYKKVFVVCKTTSYSVSPNPASTSVTISAINSNVSIESISSETSFDFVKIYDFQGNLKKNVTSSKARNTSINVDNLQVGTYIFEVGNANYSEKHQVVIRK